LFRDYERAFSDATRMPLTFQPVDSWQLSLRGKKYENPFCALLGKSSAFCSKCLEQQSKLADPNAKEIKTNICFAGLCESSVPVRVGNDILGFLQTGQVALKKPTRLQFNRISKQILEWGVKTDLKSVEETYFHSRVISKKEYHAMVRLLEVFAQHLSMTADQLAIHHEHSEPGAITKAKEFINEHKTEEISLDDVARRVNMSTFYFCKMFKKATGVTFTEYLSLVRVTKAKNLLLNPNLRISEIAFEVGFQSLTHFNRVFRKIIGQSPTQYRAKLPHTTGI
jgi:AraC-like DNA-binding protein/ligand-binding sensor protein